MDQSPDTILDKMKSHFLSIDNELRSFDVAALGITIYYRPTANCAQTDKYLPEMRAGKMEGYVQLLLTRALNERGGKVFQPEDAHELRVNCDPSIISDIGNKILGADEEARQEAQETAKK